MSQVQHSWPAMNNHNAHLIVVMLFVLRFHTNTIMLQMRPSPLMIRKICIIPILSKGPNEPIIEELYHSKFLCLATKNIISTTIQRHVAHHCDVYFTDAGARSHLKSHIMLSHNWGFPQWGESFYATLISSDLDMILRLVLLLVLAKESAMKAHWFDDIDARLPHSMISAGISLRQNITFPIIGCLGYWISKYQDISGRFASLLSHSS